MAELQNPPRDLRSHQVLLRFFVRMTILVGFSAFGGVGLARSLAALAAMSTILCAILASAKREPFFGAQLNYWDEAVAYAALALIDLELPFWQVRRLTYDDGEWYCALSRERELPDWLDQSIESRHADLALAILGAFVEARRVSDPESRTSVPDTRGTIRDLYDTLPIDNYV